MVRSMVWVIKRVVGQLGMDNKWLAPFPPETFLILSIYERSSFDVTTPVCVAKRRSLWLLPYFGNPWIQEASTVASAFH